jgi:hypothetical protein
LEAVHLEAVQFGGSAFGGSAFGGSAFGGRGFLPFALLKFSISGLKSQEFKSSRALHRPSKMASVKASKLVSVTTPPGEFDGEK